MSFVLSSFSTQTFQTYNVWAIRICEGGAHKGGGAALWVKKFVMVALSGVGGWVGEQGEKWSEETDSSLSEMLFNKESQTLIQ